MSEGNRFSRLAAPVVAGAACAACCAAPVAAAFAAIGLTTVAGFALFGAVALVLGFGGRRRSVVAPSGSGRCPGPANRRAAG